MMNFYYVQEQVNMMITMADENGTYKLHVCVPSLQELKTMRNIGYSYLWWYMYNSPRGRFQDPYCGGWGSRCIKELKGTVSRDC
jgi:hypothetical protein